MKRTILFLMSFFLIQSEDAYALRPFIAATATGIVEPGNVEVEMGLGFERNTRGSASETTSNLPSLALNIGLARNLEFDIGTGFDLVRERLEDGTRRTLGSAAEASLTAKVRFFEGEGSAPSIATELTVLLPSQRRKLLPNGKRSAAFTGILAATTKLGPLVAHFNLGGGVSKSPEDAGDTVGSFLWAIAGELPISNEVSLVAEFRGTSVQQSLPDNTALGGLTWESPWGVKFDVAGFGGLSRGAVNGGATLGLTFSFDALQWR